MNEWRTRLAVTAPLGTMAAAGLVTIERGLPFGHDEAVYGLRAVDFVAGTGPGTEFRPYRAPGMPWLQHWVLGIERAAESVLRAVVVGFAMALAGLTFLVGRRAGGVFAGLIASIGLVLTPSFLGSATRNLPDVPGAALSLGFFAVLWWALDRERAPWWVWTAPALAVAATWVRFGSPVPIGAALIVLTVSGRPLARGPWRRPWVGVGALSVLGPSLILLTDTGRGSPLSAMLDLRSAKGTTVLDGALDYVDLWQRTAAPHGILMAVGLAFAIVALVRGSATRDQKTIAAMGALTLIGITVIARGEIRYLAPAMPFFWVLVGVGWSGALVRDRWARTVALAATAGVLFVSGVTSPLVAERNVVDTEVRDAGRTIEALARSAACEVRTAKRPQTEWYSGCETIPFVVGQVREPRGSDGVLESLMYIDGFIRQPEGAVLEAYLSFTAQQVFDGDRVDLWLLEDPADP